MPVEAVGGELIDTPGAAIPSSTSEIHPLIRGNLLAWNTIINLFGQIAPMTVGLFAVPHLIALLGTARFGLLTLSWVVLGYFGIFDLGLGRALTKLVAENFGRDAERTATLVWTALLMLCALGVAAAAVALSLVPSLVGGVMKIPQELRDEAFQGFVILAASIPIVLLTTALRGVLEAQQRFGIVNAVRIPMNALSFLAPLLVAAFMTRHLSALFASLVAVRLAGCVAYFVASVRSLPALRRSIRFDSASAGALFRFGGWMTVSNVVNPIMSYLDRFIVGALLSLAAVAYYATPYDVVMNLAIIPGAVTGVLFPAFSAHVNQEPSRAALLFVRGAKAIAVMMFPIALVIFAFAPEGLNLWLGPIFSAKSTPVVRWLALGLFVNSIAYVPFAFIQAAGRPDLSAKLHFLELPGYLALVWVLLRSREIEGVAMAWFIRAAIDAAILFALSARLLPELRTPVKRFGAASAAAVLVFWPFQVSGLSVRMVMIVVAILLFAIIVATRVLSGEERQWVAAVSRRALTLRFPTRRSGGSSYP